MSGKFKKLALFLLCAATASTAFAKAARNVVVYYLPLRQTSSLDSLQESVVTPTQKGTLPTRTTKNPPSARTKSVRKEGFATPVGTSLYDKPSDWSNKDAESAVLTPAKVLIMPPDKSKVGKKMKKPASNKAGLSNDVNSTKVRVYPLTKKAEIQKEVKQTFLERKELRRTPLPPKDISRDRPSNPDKWTKWIIDRLKECDGSKRVVLPTLYWMMANNRLTDGETVCSMKSRVSDYLRQCHPWPTVYYTPFNNDTPVNPAVQMSAEIIETAFDKQSCPALNLSGVNFQNVTFADADLNRHDFTKSYFKGAYFLRARMDYSLLKGAFFEDVRFQDTTMRTAYLKDATLRFSHFYDVDLSLSILDDADVSNTQFRNVRMSMAKARKTLFDNTDWFNVRVDMTQLMESSFRNAEMVNVLLDNALISRTDFSEISCRRCLFKNVFGEYAVFLRSSFGSGTQFTEGSLSFANFSQAVFHDDTSFRRTDLYHADFKDADIAKIKDFNLDTERKVFVNRKTKLPANLPDIDDPDIDFEQYRKDVDISKLEEVYLTGVAAQKEFACGKTYCDTLETGRTTLQYLALRARTVLVNPSNSVNDRRWAVCTIGCIAFRDKKLESSNVEALAAFVRTARPWSVEGEGLFAPYKEPDSDIVLALRLLTHRNLDRDVNGTVDLSYTDLRKMDFSDSNLLNMSFEGANLSGANLSKARTNAEYAAFNGVVFDEFTRFPPQMELFAPFELPDSKWPDWWDPETVMTFSNTTDPWDGTIADMPLEDEYIVPVAGMDELIGELVPEEEPEEDKPAEDASAEEKKPEKAVSEEDAASAPEEDAAPKTDDAS